MPDITKRAQYDRLKTALFTEQSSFRAQWTEIAQYLFPMRPRFTVTDRNRGDRRNQSIIDSTAMFAASTLASGLHSGLTSPARPWMKLSVPDPSLAKRPGVSAWLFDVTERMHAVFHLSNLYNALPLVYGDMGIFGTAAVGILDDPGAPGQPPDLFRCYTYPIGSYAMGTDNRGLVTTFVRESAKTVAQLVEEFGGVKGRKLERGQDPQWQNFSRAVKTAWDRHQYEVPFKITWIVQPNYDYEGDHRLDGRRFPWSSCHYEEGADSGTFLRESGFYEFPILAPRWFVNAEDTYGTQCPGMMALGDTKQLQVMQKRKGQAIEKMINPPLVGPSSLRSQKTSLLPGEITYADIREGMQGLRPIHEVKPDLSAFLPDLQEVQYRINQAFYVNLFLMLTFGDGSRGAQPPTAREVDERHEEKLTALGPVLESTIDELLDPLVDRVFAMMSRAGLVPPAPPELHGVEMTVEYVSMLAQAQKMQRVGLLDRFMTTSMAAAQIFPEITNVVDAEAITREYADDLGLDPKLLRTPEAIAARQQQQQQAAQAQAQAEQFSNVASGAKDLSQTNMNGDTALNRLVSGVTG